ncbi:DUF2318 domain-containing protein [Geotalea toluenoxydans]
MPILAKGLTLLILWGVLVVGLTRTFAARKSALTAGSVLGLITGTVAGFLLFNSFTGELPFAIIKSLVAVAFISLFIVAAFAWHKAPAPAITEFSPSLSDHPAVTAMAAFLSATVFAILAVCRLSNSGDNATVLAVCFILPAMVELWLVVYRLEPLLPSVLKMPRGGLPLLAVSLFLFIASFSPRLDLFSPLSMKVMKLIHDFVHQFFESMLIPDHPFFRTDVWDYIGMFFSNSVGFWGGLIIWFIPSALIAIAVFRQPLPSVAHVRQAATRRKLIAGHLRERRCLLFFPFFATILMAVAVYESGHPSVEYWDPKPIAVKADGAGTIHIPVKDGETDLKDGKLHKYIFLQGAKKVRFFVLYRSDELTVVLDACSICQPEGYGQSEGTVICYYCKTLIPLETVGKPGGCNPVPVSFTADAGGVHLSAVSLINTWNEQVQSAKKVPGGPE